MRLPGCLALAVLSLLTPRAVHAGAPAPACIERRFVDQAVPSPSVPTGPVVGIDAAGSVLAAWGYEFSIPGELYTARYDAVTGWGPKTPLDTGPAEDRVNLPSLAVNADGEALLAWSGQAGIYAAAFVPGDGWQETQTIDSGTSAFLTFAQSLNGRDRRGRQRAPRLGERQRRPAAQQPLHGRLRLVGARPDRRSRLRPRRLLARDDRERRRGGPALGALGVHHVDAQRLELGAGDRLGSAGRPRYVGCVGAFAGAWP